MSAGETPGVRAEHGQVVALPPRVLRIELKTAANRFPWTYPNRAYRRVVGAAFGTPLAMPFDGSFRRWKEGIFAYDIQVSEALARQSNLEAICADADVISAAWLRNGELVRL